MGKNHYRIGKVASGKCLLCAEPVSVFTKALGVEACICEECNDYALSIEKSKVGCDRPVLVGDFEENPKPKISFRGIKKNLPRSWEQKMEQFYFNAG